MSTLARRFVRRFFRSKHVVLAGAALALALGSGRVQAAVPYALTNGTYVCDFADIANWGANFASGIGASNWASVAVHAGGTIPDGTTTTTGTATFSTGSSGGVQKGIGTIMLLSTGTTDNTTADAIDLLLDFTGTNAGTLSFDWAETNNGTGPREGSIRVYGSTDNATFTEIPNTFVSVTNPIAASGSVVAVALPAAFNNSATARIRFYYYNGGVTPGSPAGSRPKISIDNVTATAAAAQVAPVIGSSPTNLTAIAGTTASFMVTLSSGTAPLTYRWYKDNGLLSNGGQISGANTNVLNISAVASANEGDYVVIVSNAVGSATSAPPAHLTVTNEPPQILIDAAGRTALLGTVASFPVTVEGALPLTYQWTLFGTNISDDAHITGTTTSTLTISNLVATDAGDYQLIVTNAFGSNASSIATLTLAQSGVLAGWNFNGPFNINNPATSIGSSAAQATTVQSRGFSNSVASGSDPGFPNSAWGTDTYPAQGASNKTSGVQFKVSTVGFRNLTVSYDQRATATTSRYSRLQYTTNGTTWVDFPFSTDINPNNLPANAVYHSQTNSLAGFPGVANNPNFGLRVVTEFEGTAKYGATNSTVYVGNTSTYATSGTMTFDLFNIYADAITNGNTPPIITGSSNFTIVDTASFSTNVNIGDLETATNALTVFAVSGNHSILGDPLFNNNGDGTATVQFSPSLGQDGIAPIILTVSDADGNSAATAFNVTVVPGNQPPTLTGLIATNCFTNVTLTIPFIIGDDQTAAGSLTLDKATDNQTLVPLGNISFGGSGSNRTVIITPATGKTGIAPIYVSVNDGDKTTVAGFTLMVRPSTNIVFNESFDYDTNGSIIADSLNVWQTHSGTAGQMQVINGEVYLNRTNSEDVNALLIGEPYSSNSPVVLYSSFKVRFIDLPSQNGSYFAHFKDDNTGAPTGFGARVWASTLNAASGQFRLGIANGAASTNTAGQFPLDLSLGNTYLVVTKFVPSTGIATIWVNPTNENDLSVTATDAGTPTRPNPIDVLSYGLRESQPPPADNDGVKFLDDLNVGLTFTAVSGLPSTPPPPPPHPTINSISIIGGSVVIRGTNNNTTGGQPYWVLTSTNIGAPVSNWTKLSTNSFSADGSFSYTNGPASGQQTYYLLQVP